MRTKVNKPVIAPKVTKDKPAAPKKTNAEISKLVADLNKRFGENCISIGVTSDSGPVKRIPTGSFSLDMSIGGGIPVGRCTQISGAYSSTKTSQAIHIIREAQKMGYTCAYIDVEGTSDEYFFESIGVDYASLLYSRPESLEEATEILLQLQRSGVVQVGVIDSVAALSANKEQETSMEDTVQMGVTQKLWGEFARKYQMNNNHLTRNGKESFTLILINQLREKVGAYGDPEYTPGGRAIGFLTTLDIRFRRGDWIKEGTGGNQKITGQIVKFKIEKNKTFTRMQTGEFDYYFADNTANVVKYHNDYLKDVVITGYNWGIIERSGSWFVYKDKKVQGAQGMVDLLRNEPDIVEDIRTQVLNLSMKGRA